MAGPRRIVERSGVATIEVDQSQVMAQIDRITKGAVSSFLKAAHRQMDPVVLDARSNRQLWPRRTGASLAATMTIDRIKGGDLEVVALNRVPYTYKLRFSVVTSATIDNEARQIAASTWERMAPYVERVGNDGDVTQDGPYAGRRGAKRRVAHWYLRESGGGLFRRKWAFKEDPSEDVIRRIVKRDLISRHGTGAPNPQIAGKHVWNTRVRNPVRKRTDAVIEESRQALDTLAGG